MKQNFPGGFTVLIAVYNNDNPTLFRMALDSIFQNDLRPDSVVLVVDGPVNISLEECISQFETNSEFKVIRLECNGGLYNALNVGLKYVNTSWVVRADSDDVNALNRFRKLSEKINEFRGKIDLVGSQILEHDEFGNPLSLRRVPQSHKELVRFIKFRNPFNHMSVAFKTEAVVQVGGYPAIEFKEDYALWAKMIADGATTYNLSDVTVNVTAGRSMVRRRGGISYAVSELKLQRLLLQLKLTSLPTAVFIGMVRSVIFLSPSVIRALFYKFFLRTDRGRRDF